MEEAPSRPSSAPCGCKGHPDTPGEAMDALRAIIRDDLREAVSSPLSEMVALWERSTPVRVVPSDVTSHACREVAAGHVVAVPHSLDRLRVSLSVYATDGAGTGKVVAFVGAPGETLAADGVSGRGHPLVWAEANPSPMVLTFDTRAALEVRIVEVTGDAILTVSTEYADADRGI